MGRNFMKATVEAWHYAKDNPEKACAAHVKANPQIELDDCMGNLTAALKYIFNDFSSKNGLGHFNESRLQSTYSIVAKAQKLPADWDVHNAIDARFIDEVNPVKDRKSTRLNSRH